MDKNKYKQMAIIESLYDLRILIAENYKSQCAKSGCQSSNHCNSCDRFNEFNESMEKELIDYSLGRKTIT